MQKLLILLTTSLIGNSTISNINLSIKTNINTKTENIIVNNNELDSDKLDNWHNTLSIKQDAIAKEQYLDSINITTTKFINSNFDNYNITFDNSKLQNMLKNGIINQDVYNVWSSKDYSEGITSESNTIVSIPSLNNLPEKKVRESDAFFHIKNNKMFFIENKSPINQYAGIGNAKMMFEIDRWWNTGRISEAQSIELSTELMKFIMQGANRRFIFKWWKIVVDNVMENVLPEAAPEIEALCFAPAEVIIGDSNNNFSDYKVLNQLAQNITKTNDVNTKYHSQGTEANIYLFKIWLDPNSIKPIPPINNGTTFDDIRGTGWFHGGQTFTHDYDYNTLISYDNYDSLWEFLNSNVKFNLHKKFESSIGISEKYKSYNTIFNKNESSNMLKKYWNNYVELTETQWNAKDGQTSKAEILLSITDNPWNKTINFNFKSILMSTNFYFSTENWMYN